MSAVGIVFFFTVISCPFWARPCAVSDDGHFWFPHTPQAEKTAIIPKVCPVPSVCPADQVGMLPPDSLCHVAFPLPASGGSSVPCPWGLMAGNRPLDFPMPRPIVNGAFTNSNAISDGLPTDKPRWLDFYY